MYVHYMCYLDTVRFEVRLSIAKLWSSLTLAMANQILIGSFSEEEKVITKKALIVQICEVFGRCIKIAGHACAPFFSWH